MTKILFFTFFSLPLAHSIVWNSTVVLNADKYLPWDYSSGKLFYLSNGSEYRFDSFINSCLKYSTKYIPTTYLLTRNFYFVNDIVKERTWRLDYDVKGFFYEFQPIYSDIFENLNQLMKYTFILDVRIMII